MKAQWDKDGRRILLGVNKGQGVIMLQLIRFQCVWVDLNWTAMYINAVNMCTHFRLLQNCSVLDIPECNNWKSFGVSVEGIRLHSLSDQSNKPSYYGNFSHLDSSFVYRHSLFPGHLCIIYSFCWWIWLGKAKCTSLIQKMK